MSMIDLAIWLTLIAGKLFLCLCLFKRDVLRRLPIFSAYVLGSTIRSVLTISLALWGSYTLYYDFFFWSAHAESLLAFCTLVEFSWQVLPGLDLPRRREALTWLVAALGMIVIFVSFWPFQLLAKRIEVAAYLVLAAAFVCVTVYAYSLGLRWSRFLGGVSFTLGFLYIVQGTTKSLMGHFPPASMLLIRQLSLIANIAAVISWTIFVLIPWGEYKLTEEDLAKFEAIVNAAEQSVRRFIASGGE